MGIINISSINEQKKILRQQLRLKRQCFFANNNMDGIAAKIKQHFFELNILKKDSIIGGYWSYGSETPINSLLIELHHYGYPVTLPVAERKNKIMEFRNWNPSAELQKDEFGISCPNYQQPLLNPNILLIPLLAFNNAGDRLGQGGGYYDRTISFLRRNYAIITIGIGYEIQKFDHIPLLETDEKLDYILTEQHIYSINTSSLAFDSLL